MYARRVRKILSVLGTLLVIAVIAVMAYLKWWNIWGQADQGEACSGRAGCKSFYCLQHEMVSGVEQTSKGYCTASCDSDKDCVKGLQCVVPTPQALDDLPAHGRPSKLCERMK